MVTPKLRFKEFDGDWANFNLGDISDIKTGPFGSTLHQKDYVEIGTPIITVEHLGEVGLTSQNLPLVSDEDKVRLKSYMLDEGDLAFSRVGSVDRCAIITDKEKGWLFSGRILRVRPNKKLVHSKNLMYALKTEDAKYRIRSVAVGQTMPSLNTEILKNFSINLSNSVEEQTKIASFLSNVDEKISQLTQKHELLSQYKQGMMQKLFSQQIRFKADDGSEFGEWEEIKLTDFLKFTPRPIEKPNTNYHALGVRSHFKGLFNKFDSEPNKISMDTLYRVKRNDVVVNITFAWEGAMAIAEKEHDEGLVSHRFPTYLCDDSKINLHFFKYRFIQKDFLSALQLCSPGGAGRNRVLNKSAFLEISFSKPTLEEQTKIANFLSSIDQKIEVVAQQIEQAKTWKKGLLQQMFV